MKFLISAIAIRIKEIQCHMNIKRMSRVNNNLAKFWSTSGTIHYRFAGSISEAKEKHYYAYSFTGSKRSNMLGSSISKSISSEF